MTAVARGELSNAWAWKDVSGEKPEINAQKSNESRSNDGVGEKPPAKDTVVDDNKEVDTLDNEEQNKGKKSKSKSKSKKS